MAGRIPEQFIDDLLARVDIVDVIEAHLPLRKAGREFQALCPFHGEKTPSFTVSREKQFFHCFGCGAHGTAVGFLMQHRSLEFPEAIEELAQMVGVEVPREGGTSTRTSDTRELYAVLERARTHFEQQLRQADSRVRAVDYFKGRGVSGEIARRFHLGFAPDGWRNLCDALIAEGYADTLLERTGLVIKRERGGYYDRFRERVMFPIHDRRGRVIGFGGRVIGEGEPKYLNSPETEVFHKGRELYGLHEAIAGGKPQSLIVVEGYMDVIALAQHDLTNAVATLGTAVTGDHLDQLFRHVPEVVFCFDGDAAGRRAAWKALEIALPRMAGDRQVRFAFLPEGHDPDTAVRAFGAAGFLREARRFGLSEYLIDQLKSDIDLTTADGRTRLVAQAVEHLRQIPDEAHRVTGARLLAALSQLDEDLIRGQLGFRTRRRQRAQVAPLARFTSRTLEQQALAMLLQQPTLAACIDADAVQALTGLETATLLLSVHAQAAAGLGTAALLERFRGTPYEATVLELAATDLNIDPQARETELRDAVGRLAQKAEDQRIQHIRAIPFAELTTEQKETLRNYRRRPAAE
ncbi:MAG: DNA primase [Gammaproteobacteria bacterium]